MTAQNQFFGKSKIPMVIKLKSHAHVMPTLTIMLIVEMKRPLNGHVTMRAAANVSNAVTRKIRRHSGCTLFITPNGGNQRRRRGGGPSRHFSRTTAGTPSAGFNGYVLLLSFSGKIFKSSSIHFGLFPRAATDKNRIPIAIKIAISNQLKIPLVKK